MESLEPRVAVETGIRRKLFDDLPNSNSLKLPEVDFMSQFSITNEQRINQIRDDSKLEKLSENILTSPQKISRKNAKVLTSDEEMHSGLLKGQKLLFSPKKNRDVTASPIKTNQNIAHQYGSPKQVRAVLSVFPKLLNDSPTKSKHATSREYLKNKCSSSTNPRLKIETINFWENEPVDFTLSEEFSRSPLKIKNQSRVVDLQSPVPQTPVKKMRYNNFGLTNEQEKEATFVSPSIRANFNTAEIKSKGSLSIQPQTPRKMQSRFGTTSVNKAASVCQSVKDNTFKISGVSVATTKFAFGTYLEASKISAVINFVKDVENSDVLLKTFLPQHANSDSDVVKYMTNSIANYRKIKALELPCSKIYNLETAIDDRYYLVELIPDPIDLSNADHMSQVFKIFEVSAKNELVCDLSFSNLRVKNGIVYIIDFDERAIKFDRTFKHRDITIQLLKSWASPIAKKLYYEGRSKASELLYAFNKHLGFEAEMVEDVLNQYFKKPQLEFDQQI